mgnify:CR=1 FL=1
MQKDIIITDKIYLIRGKKVMLSTHLAELYEVPPKVLIQAVKRNIVRFPEDFMFQLSLNEYEILKSQFVTSSWGGLRRALPYAFTEQGVAMLSSVLKSERAVLVNIEIMRTFARLREMIQNHQKLWDKILEIEKKYDGQFKIVFDALRALLEPPEKPKRKIGFH